MKVMMMHIITQDTMENRKPSMKAEGSRSDIDVPAEPDPMLKSPENMAVPMAEPR